MSAYLYPGCRLATFRQVDHWASNGALGPDKQSPGSGRHREWIERELRALDAIAECSNAVRQVAGGTNGLSLEIIWALWHQFTVGNLDSATFSVTTRRLAGNFDSVTLRADIPKERP